MKTSRADFDFTFDENNELLQVRWKDNNMHTMTTNYDSYESVEKVKRFSFENKIKKNK